MSQERYGIRRFALLNTAGYSLGLFPLEHPLSVYGANNLGKSASINALQFPILARMSDMSFGKYSLEQSRRFYFASDTSYILCELSLPHGPHVIGVVGRGPGGGFGHQFFAYKGELDLAHYQKNDTCLRQKELFTNLERLGIKAYELKPDELRRLLVGGHTSVPLDLTMIPLRSTSEQSLKTFRALFINLLHMREITAAKLKQLFLDAFEHSLRSGSVDYIAACEEAFRDVRRMEQDYNALVAAGPLVEALAGGVAQRDILRGKLHRISPVLDTLLGTWQEYAMARKEELVIQSEHYRGEQDRLQNDQRGGTQELMRLEREITGIQRWLGELSVLKHRFALVDDVKVLEQQLLAAKDAHDELAGALAQSRQFSAEDLDERVRDLEKRLKQVKQQLDHADNNSYARLREEFSQADVDRLMRLFNGALFSLPLGDRGIELDDSDLWVKSLEAVLDGFKGERFEAPGLAIDLTNIDPPALQALADRAALRDQKERLEKELKQLKTQQAVAADRSASKAQTETLYQEVLDAQKALEDFRRTETLSAEEPEKLEQLSQLEAAQDELKRSSDAFTERVQQLSAKLQLVGRQIGDLESKQRTLEDALRRRQLLPADLPYGTPFMEAIDDSMDNLLPLLNDYQDSWQALQRVDNQIEALYAQVRLKGVAKFDSEDDMERRLQLLVNAYAHRTDEALTLAKHAALQSPTLPVLCATSAATTTASSTSWPCSTARSTSAGVQPGKLPRGAGTEQGSAQAHRPDHHSAGQYEEGETLSVFDLTQSAEQDNRNEEAKEYLARLVAANHNQLGLKDLFELAFEITKVNGQPVIHADIDGAASNGTTMTIKALTNMYLLLHLMDRDLAGRIRLPYYLDEAADIDERNQAALLETSLQLGFVPILASVKPQVSARVAIDLEGGSGPNGIYIDEADWKFISRLDEVKAVVREDKAEELA